MSKIGVSKSRTGGRKCEVYLGIVSKVSSHSRDKLIIQHLGPKTHSGI